MKRMMAVVLVLSVLCTFLVGCREGTGIPETHATTVPTAPLVTETEPAPTETVPEQTEPAPTEAEYFYRSKYTRLSEEPLTELIPDENYGCILPYCAGLESYYICGDPYGRYGFMDATGMIIVDPVYQYIEPLLPEDGYDFTPCVWLMMQGEIRQDDDMDVHYHLNNKKCGLAAADGSVVIDPVYDDVEVLGNGIFAKKYLDESHDKYDVDIYNLDCQLIGSLTNLDVDIIGYGDGILRVEKEWRPCYMDMSGEIFAGPFVSAEDFSCGYGLVEVEWDYGTQYTYVDKEGKLLSEEGWTFVAEDGESHQITGFSYAEPFVNGVACVRVDHLWEQYSVLTTDNTFLFDFRIFNEYRCTEDYILNNSLGNTEVYDHAGELLWSAPELELEPVFGCDSTFLYDPFGNKIYNRKTGEIVEGFEGVTDVGLPFPYGEDLPYLLFENEEKEEMLIVDEELHILAQMDQYAYQYRDPLTGKTYFWDCESGGECFLIVPHLPQPKINIEEIAAGREVCIYNDLIQCTDGGGCFYYTYDLELIFCYSFNDYEQ